MTKHENSLNWFEIPVNDLSRARHFYQVIFSMHMEEQPMMGMEMILFPYEMGSGKVAGALIKSSVHIPSTEGISIYLNANPDLSTVLEKVEEQGGKVLMPKTLINEQTGHMAIFIDTEGNRIGLHSQH